MAPQLNAIECASFRKTADRNQFWHSFIAFSEFLATCKKSTIALEVSSPSVTLDMYLRSPSFSVHYTTVTRRHHHRIHPDTAFSNKLFFPGTLHYTTLPVAF
jgi:hypothetical protein